MLRARHGLVLAVLGLLVVATVMVNSASLNLSGRAPTTTESVFWGKHTWFALGAMAALAVGCMVPVERLGTSGKRWWSTPVTWVAAVAVLGLLLVHVPGIGREANGARRWITLGPIGLQPSELAKWGVPIVLAWYCIRERARMGSFIRGFALPLAAVSAVCGIIAIEDLGTAVLIELVAVAMLVAAGARWWFAAALAPVGLVAFAGLVIASPYRVNRIAAFLNPYEDARGIGYHIIQSLEAISGGGLAGRGLGNSELKFGYLPEATTDFIYSIVTEELGITGAILVVALYVMLILGGLAILASATRRSSAAGPAGTPLLPGFSQLLGYGIILTVGLQALINIAVVTGLAPTKGIALPLMSRGGTGWILTCLSLGMVVAMDLAADRTRRALGEPIPGESDDDAPAEVSAGTADGVAGLA